MSAVARIKIGFQKVLPGFRIVRVRPSEIVEAFVRYGWVLEGELYGHRHDAICWSSRPVGDGPEDRLEYRGQTQGAVEAIRQWEPKWKSFRQWEPAKRRIAAVTIWWPATGDGGELWFNDEKDAQSLDLWRSAAPNWRNLPGYESFTDDNFYVPKLIGPLEQIGAGVYEVMSWYHC